MHRPTIVLQYNILSFICIETYNSIENHENDFFGRSYRSNNTFFLFLLSFVSFCFSFFFLFRYFHTSSPGFRSRVSGSSYYLLFSHPRRLARGFFLIGSHERGPGTWPKIMQMFVRDGSYREFDLGFSSGYHLLYFSFWALFLSSFLFLFFTSCFSSVRSLYLLFFYPFFLSLFFISIFFLFLTRSNQTRYGQGYLIA